MTRLELTSEQKHDISVELNASDMYETVPFLNKVLAAIGYVDRLEDDSEREELRWTKRKEPLIKNEKIRKAVRAWAEVNLIKEAMYAERRDRSLCVLTDMGNDDFNIEFVGWIPTLIDSETYAIAELCGEEG